MKRLIFSIIAIVASLSAMAAGPDIVFASTDHDFGNIKEFGGPVSCEFSFTNEGDAPLVIVSASASCGCTRPTYPTKPIEPGKSGVIKVTYVPQGRPGDFAKSVNVRTNVSGKKKLKLHIRGFVIPQDGEK